MLEPWILSAHLALCVAIDPPAPVHEHAREPRPAAVRSGPPVATRVADASNDDGTVIDRMAASYAFIGGERERKGLAEAIEAVVEAMNIFVRGIARDRLTETNQIPSSLVIRRQGRRITVSLEDRTYSAELGGPPVTVTGSTGDALRLTYRLRDQRLVQAFVGERGGRTNTYFVDAEGRLRVDVEVHSPRLPKDLRYRLSFGKRS
jgi:hypothetical protein